MTMNDIGFRRTVAACMSGKAAAPRISALLKTWRHGIIEAKSDAGILFMMDKGGFCSRSRA